MSKYLRSQFEEIHFSMICGIATKKDFDLVLNPKKDNLKFKPYYHKVASTLYTKKDYIIKVNQNITEELKEEIYKNAKDFIFPEQKLIQCAKLKYTQLEEELFQKDSLEKQKFTEQLRNKILYEQSSDATEKEPISLKLLFYILMIIFVQTKKAESLKNELETLFDKTIDNRYMNFEKLVNLSIKMNIDFIDLEYIYEQIPKEEENSENELLLFSTKILYYFLKEGDNFVNVFISVITNENSYIYDKYFTGLNLMLKYSFFCDTDKKTFLTNINTIFYQSKWYCSSLSIERNNPSHIEINLINTIYSYMKEKHWLTQYVLLNISYIEKLNCIIPLLFEIANESEQLPTIFEEINGSLTKLMSLSQKNPFLNYQIYYFMIFWKDNISKDNKEKIKRIKLSSKNKTNEKINIHFLFCFLHPILRTMLLSPKVQENNKLIQSYALLNTKDTIIDPFEIMHYEDFEGEDCFTKEKAFFYKYTGISNIISIIPKLESKENHFIQLYRNHFKDNMKRFNEFPFIVYHPFSLKNRKLNKELLMNIKEIEINDKLFYEFTGIITSKEIYIYNKLKEQFYYVNKDIWINLYEIPSNQEISLVYFKYESRDIALLSINMPLECKEEQTFNLFAKEEQQKIIIDSFLWIAKEYINWILKNETFFIKFFNLLEPIRIQELYNVYKQQANPNLQKFCLDLINKYEKKVKKSNEILTDIKIQLKLWTADEFILNFNNYLFGDVPEKNITEQKIVHFINYYLEHFEDIPSDDYCKVVTLLTSLILIKQHPDNDYLLKISVGSPEKRNKHVLKLIKSIKSNIEEHQLKDKISNYWKNCTSSEKLSEALNCDLMFLVVQKQNLTIEQFKTFLEPNKHLYRDKFEDQYNFLFNYIHEKYAKSSYRLYRDLICIFFESSPLFISKGQGEPSIIEWKLFEHYIKEIICNETIVLTKYVTNFTKEERVSIVTSILMGYKGQSEKSQKLLIDYFGLLRNGNILLQKCIREQLINYTKNLNFPDLQFMIISFFHCCKIKRKANSIEQFVETSKQNHKVSDWTWIDVHYLFISLHKDIKLGTDISKETFLKGLDELYKDKKNIKINSYDSSTTPPIFPLNGEEDSYYKNILNRDSPLFSIITSTETKKTLGDIVYYVMQPTIENIEKEILMDIKYALKGLLLIKKTTLKDILLYNNHNQYFYSLSSKKTWINTHNHTKEAYSTIVGVYHSAKISNKTTFSYNDINEESKFSFIKKHYLSEIICFLKHNIHTFQKHFELFNRAFDFKTNLHQIKELKEYSSLSNEEKILFDKTIHS